AAGISYEMKIPMADSLILATAKSMNAILWTQDSDFIGITDVRYSKK
ncbi:MAG: VapC toxin family PIN domain ribonuclease, partial [Spirochaetes bacterium]